MQIRPARHEDVPRILEINKQNDFPLPKFDNLLTQAVITEDDKIVAFGMVKAFAEAILILDHTQSKRIQVRALQELMLEAIRGSYQHKMVQLHCFIKDEEFETLMKKHYGFEDCSGKALVLNL